LCPLGHHHQSSCFLDGRNRLWMQATKSPPLLVAGLLAGDDGGDSHFLLAGSVGLVRLKPRQSGVNRQGCLRNDPPLLAFSHRTFHFSLAPYRADEPGPVASIYCQQLLFATKASMSRPGLVSRLSASAISAASVSGANVNVIDWRRLAGSAIGGRPAPGLRVRVVIIVRPH